MKKYLNLKNFLRFAVLVFDAFLMLYIVKFYQSDRRAEASRVKKLKNEVQAEAEAALAAESLVSDVEELEALLPPTTFSVRGDSFRIENGATGTDYPTLLEKLLIESGYIATVSDYTIDVPGTLADMYYAGVDSATLQYYIDLNKLKDTAGTFEEIETNIGAVTSLNTARNDKDSIPIIFIGYYGGFGQDPYELIKQQEEILATYNQREFFLIVGLHPQNYPNTDAFDEAMSDYWGKHYLNLTSKVPLYRLNTLTGHEAIAKAIMARLKSQGMLTLNTDLIIGTTGIR